MGYKNYSSNLDIRPRRMTVLDHFPSDHYCEIWEMDHSSNSDIRPRRIVVHGISTICQPGPFSTRENVYPPTIFQPGPSSIGNMSVHQKYTSPRPFSAWRMFFHQHTHYPSSWKSSPTLVVVSVEIRTMPSNRTQLCLSIVVHNYYPMVHNIS
jgi:hypothetical protein